MSVNFQDVSTRGGGLLLSDASRKHEVQRLAQGVAAEHFGPNAVGQQQQQQPQNGNSSQTDVAKISVEAIEELTRVGRPEDLQRTDQLVSALQQAFQTKAGDEKRQNQQGASGDEAQNKPLEKKKTVHWEPEAQAGQIHTEGQEVIGKITVKEEVKEAEGPGQGAQASPDGSRNDGARSGNGNSSQAASSQKSGNGGASLVASGKDGLKAQEQEGKNDKEGAAAAQSLKASGLQAPGMEKGAENYEVGEKSKDFDVRSPATGASQTLTMREAGKLGEGEQTLGTYKRLDDSPAMRYASLHSRGQGLDRTAEDYAQVAGKAGESPDKVAKSVEKLKSATADQ